MRREVNGSKQHRITSPEDYDRAKFCIKHIPEQERQTTLYSCGFKRITLQVLH